MTYTDRDEKTPRVRDMFKNGNVRKCREHYEKNRHVNFKKMKEQCNSIKESGYQGIDAEMIPYLEFINSIPDVATTWCCSGHYKESENVGSLRPRLVSSKRNKRHVSFMLEGIGYHPLLEAIEDCLRATDSSFNINLKVTLRQVPLHWKFSQKGSVDDHYYTSYFLEITPGIVPTVELYEILCNAFLEALKERYFEIVEERRKLTMLTYVKETNQQLHVRKFKDIEPIKYFFNLQEVAEYVNDKEKLVSACAKMRLNVVSDFPDGKNTIIGFAEFVDMSEWALELNLYIVEAAIHEEFFHQNYSAMIKPSPLSWNNKDGEDWSVIISPK